MNARQLGLLAAMLGVAAVLHAQGRTQWSTAPVFQSEGRQRVFFNTDCGSSSWVVVIASSPISYSTMMESIVANTAAVCLSSSTQTGACTSTTLGPELPPESTLTDYGHGEWWCRSVTGEQYIKGYRTFDKGDLGGLSMPELQ